MSGAQRLALFIGFLPPMMLIPFQMLIHSLATGEAFPWGKPSECPITSGTFGGGALFEKKEVSYVKKLDINLGINTQKSVDAAVTVMCSKVKFRINWGESLPLCEPPEVLDENSSLFFIVEYIQLLLIWVHVGHRGWQRMVGF